MDDNEQKLLRIETFFEASADAVVINVIDTGCGIPEKALSTLFVPYFTSKRHGTGLGLPVVKNIVEKLNGNICVKSRVGEGTAFTVKLPASNNARRGLKMK